MGREAQLLPPLSRVRRLGRHLRRRLCGGWGCGGGWLVLSWNNKILKGGGSLALFLAASLKARMGRDKELGPPASRRLMH